MQTPTLNERVINIIAIVIFAVYYAKRHRKTRTLKHQEYHQTLEFSNRLYSYDGKEDNEDLERIALRETNKT